jgi:hypothetical protein
MIHNVRIVTKKWKAEKLFRIEIIPFLFEPGKRYGYFAEPDALPCVEHLTI